MQNPKIEFGDDDFHLYLRLKDLIVLEPYNEETETFLEILEDYGLLPRTVVWCDEQVNIHRLYAVENTEELCEPFVIEIGELRLNMANGSQNFVRIPHNSLKDSSWKWLPGRSLSDMLPASLPESAYAWLSALAVAYEKAQVVPTNKELSRGSCPQPSR